jgi:hypothetical protein
MAPLFTEHTCRSPLRVHLLQARISDSRSRLTRDLRSRRCDRAPSLSRSYPAPAPSVSPAEDLTDTSPFRPPARVFEPSLRPSVRLHFRSICPVARVMDSGAARPNRKLPLYLGRRSSFTTVARDDLTPTATHRAVSRALSCADDLPCGCPLGLVSRRIRTAVSHSPDHVFDVRPRTVTCSVRRASSDSPDGRPPVLLRFSRPHPPRFPVSDEPARRWIHTRSPTHGPARRRNNLHSFPRKLSRFCGHPVVAHPRTASSQPRCTLLRLETASTRPLQLPGASSLGPRARAVVSDVSSPLFGDPRSGCPHLGLPTGALRPQLPARRAPLPCHQSVARPMSHVHVTITRLPV